MNGHIGKPINVTELLSEVAAWVDRRPEAADDGGAMFGG